MAVPTLTLPHSFGGRMRRATQSSTRCAASCRFGERKDAATFSAATSTFRRSVHVGQVVASRILKPVLAQTENQFSNSLIESWWRILKHQWLYLNTLDNVATVRKLVAFYVEQHNRHLPHSAFHGQTPDEMYLGTGAEIPKELARSRIAARQTRLAANRALSCQNCGEPVSLSS